MAQFSTQAQARLPFRMFKNETAWREAMLSFDAALREAKLAALPATPPAEWVEDMARAHYTLTMGRAAPFWEDTEGPVRLAFLNGARAAYTALRARVVGE